MNYRVYVKKAKPDVLPALVSGDLNYATGALTKSLDSEHYSTEEYIPIDQNKSYEMIVLDAGWSYYWVCEYDFNKTYLNSRYYRFQSRNGADANDQKKYTPVNQNAVYIRVMVRKEKSGNTSFLFLESTFPTLIHDSNSPKKEYHLLNPTLQLSDCSAGSLEFVIYPGHIYYDTKINLWTDTFYVVRTYKDGSEKIIWDGRAITSQEDSDGKFYHCEGALSYLNDVRTRKQDSSINYTIYEFLNERIVQRQTENSIWYNSMDRSFYSHIDNGEYIDGSTIICDQGVKYIFNINYESGSKWINDIKEAFGGHYRVRYRPYDDVKKDIICRSFTYIQDFERSFKILSLTEWIKINKDQQIQKGTYIKTLGTPQKPSTIYVAAKTFSPKNSKIDSHVSSGDLVLYEGKIGYVTDEKAIDNSAKIWIINGSNAVYRPEAERFPILKAKFGKDIFSAVKTSEIDQFATAIIPRGMQVTSSNGSGNDSYIFLTTAGAWVGGNYSGKIGDNTFKGYRVFDTPIDKNKNKIMSDILIDEELVKQYGYVMAVVDFEGADTPQALYNQSYDWFQDIKKKLIKQNIEISLSDLGQNVTIGNTNDPLADPEYVDIWTQIYAEIPMFDIDSDNPERYFVSALSIPLDDYLNTSVTLINNANLMSDNVISAGDIKGGSKGIIDTVS